MGFTSAAASKPGYPRASVNAKVEILYFDGCPNHEGARELVERVAGELGVTASIEMVSVETSDDAQRLRFLGSPTVRVNGRDLEPGAEQRTEYIHACRVYRHATGFAGQPDEQWLRDALLTSDAD